MHELYPLSSPKRIHFAYLSKVIRKKRLDIMKIKLNVLLLACIHFFATHTQNLGLVIHPVVDLIGQPIAKTGCTYANLPVAGSEDICPRMHQLLFNETVEILKESAEDYCIRIPNLFYITAKNASPHTSYWTSKKNILSLADIPITKTDSLIPQPINFRNPSQNTQATVALIKPWHSKKLNMTFSAGTRFVTTGPQKRHSFVISLLHPTKKKPISLNIPKSYVILQTDYSPKKARTIYNKILKSWAHMDGFIPYIWGGCSFTYTHAAKRPFRQKTCGKNTLYTIAHDTHAQKCGFDCAGLIARAAQIAGIPYYYKNTATLAAYLNPIKTYARLQDGDLIWIPGHVMAVGSLKRNTLIEARHYSHGYGKAHEIALNKVFKGINTFADLLQANNKKTTLERLDSKGNVAQTINQIKILSIVDC